MQEIRIPQLGEGLREVRIVELLRQPGDWVRRGDMLYIVETDKSTVELESPSDGRLVHWCAAAGEVIAIGSTVAVFAPASDGIRDTVAAPPGRLIPPRTRAYARSKGLSLDMLQSIPSASGKLLPTDIDSHLERGKIELGGQERYRDYALGVVQRALVYQLRRSASVVIPGSIAIEIPSTWFTRESAQREMSRPTPFQVFGHAIAQVAATRPKFRSVMLSDDRVREFPYVNIGLALARPNDEVITAVVREADTLRLSDFVRACMQQMKIALRHGDQATSAMQILLTELAGFGIVDATPTLVAPASSVFFLGAPRDSTGMVRVVLTFDHRLINGAGAAAFLVALSDFLRPQ